MTGDSNRVRAAVLVTILTLGLLGGTGVFSASVAAEQGSISFGATTYAGGDTVTVVVDDADLSTAEDYVVNIESDTELQESILSEDIADGTRQVTTNHSVADVNGDNKITNSDFVYSNNLDGSGGISSISRNSDGTVNLELAFDSDEDDSIGYTRGETVNVSYSVDSRFEGSFKINESDSNGVLHITNGDTITGTYSDESENEDRTTTASIGDETTDEDPGPLTLGSVTQFTTADLAGTALTHSESVVEIPFSEDVSKASGESGALTLADNLTVTVDGADVTDRYTLDANGSTDGQVLLSSGTPVDPRSKMTVEIDAVNDSIDTETIEPGSVDVTVAGAAVGEDDGEASAYAGTTLALVTDDGSVDTNQTFAVEDGSGTVVFSGQTGAGSQVFAFDTAARDWSGNYTIETALEDGSVDRRLDVALPELDLTADVADRTVTTADPIEGTVDADAAGRVLEVVLRSDDDGSDVVERTDVALGDDGTARFEFAATTVADAGPGSYTVEVVDAGSGATVESARIRVDDAEETSSSPSPPVVEDPAEELNASFRSPVVKEHAGDVFAFVLELDNTETAAVTVGSDANGFRANATVVDGNGDGTVGVRFNTAAAAGAETIPTDGGAVFGAIRENASGDEGTDAIRGAEFADGHNLAESIEPGNYSLAVRPGTDSNATVTDTGTLVVLPAAPTNLTTWVAPAGSAFSTRDVVAEAIDRHRLTRTAEVAVGDVVVHRVVVPGLAGEFARRPGTPTEAFFALSGAGDDSLYAFDVARVETSEGNLTGRTASSSDDGGRYVPDEGNASVVADPANDTYVIAYESTEAVGLRAGESRAAAFTVAAGWPYNGQSVENRTLTGEYELLDAGVSTVDDPIVVENATNQSIGGTTNVAPGTEFELRIRSANGTDRQLLKTKRAVVGPSGAWNVSVDFDTQRRGDRFTLTSAVDVIAPGDELLVDGVVGAIVPNASVVTSTNRMVGGGGGQGGGNGGSGGGAAAAADSASATPTAQPATPSEGADSGGSVLDSTRRFLGGVLGTFVDDAGEETLRSRLFGFDVLVSAGALTTVALFVSRRQ